MLDMDKQVFIVKRFSYGYRVLICTANEIMKAVANHPEYAGRVHALEDCQLMKVGPKPICKACQDLNSLGMDRFHDIGHDRSTQGSMTGKHHCKDNWYKTPDDEVIMDGKKYKVEVRYELSY